MVINRWESGGWLEPQSPATLYIFGKNQTVEGVVGWVLSLQAQLNADRRPWLPEKPLHTKIQAIIWEQQQEHL